MNETQAESIELTLIAIQGQLAALGELFGMVDELQQEVAALKNDRDQAAAEIKFLNENLYKAFGVKAPGTLR